MAALTISQLAGEVGVTTDTLRYYERLGLLAPSGRTTSGYRLYACDTADRLRLIKGAQRSGLRLQISCPVGAATDENVFGSGQARNFLV